MPSRDAARAQILPFQAGTAGWQAGSWLAMAARWAGKKRGGRQSRAQASLASLVSRAWLAGMAWHGMDGIASASPHVGID